MEKPINQRIKFLLEALSLSARDFSRAVGVADNNTQNYLEPRFAQPKADYLEKVLHHFESINPVWLTTGKGEPFLLKSNEVAEPSTTFIKKNTGNSIGINRGTANQTQPLADHDCAVKLEAAQQLIEQLKSQLLDKERLIQFLTKSDK